MRILVVNVNTTAAVTVTDAIADQAVAPVSEDAAEVIVLGCGGMAGLAEAVRDRAGVPVVDGVPADLRATHTVRPAGLAVLREPVRDAHSAGGRRGLLCARRAGLSRTDEGWWRSVCATHRSVLIDPGTMDVVANESEVDAYFETTLGIGDDVLTRALERARTEGLPEIAVSPLQGAFLALLVRMTGARRVLEVGTLGGYSGTVIARALPWDGSLVTLEVDPHHADVARAVFEDAEVAERVSVVVGRAADTLPELDGPFDLVFVDADKPSNATYVREALRLSHPGTVIVVDNVVRRGAVADLGDGSANVSGSREVTELIAAEPRLEATAMQTVGAKGWDGFLLARVTG